MTCCWRCWMLTPCEAKGSPRPHTLSLAHWSQWSLETPWGMGYPSNHVQTWKCEAFSELWEKTELLWWGCRSVTWCELSSLLDLHIGVLGGAVGCSPLCFWHCNSCTAIVPFLRLCKSTLWNQASEQHCGTGNCCLSFSEAELRGRGKGTGLRWWKKLRENTLVSVSQSKTFKHWLNNVLFQHGMVPSVEQHHLGQMFTSVCWSLGNACSAADLDKVPRYRQCEGAYSQICNGCKALHLK